MTWSLPTWISKPLLAYYFGPDHPAKQRLWYALYRLLGRPRFIVPYAETARLSLNMKDFIQFEILKNGQYELDVWESLVRYIDAKEVIWDIGANIGSFAFRAATHPGVQEVHAFEPSPTVFSQLAKNASLNPHLPVHLHAAALAKRSELRSFFSGLEGNSGVGGFFPHWQGPEIKVSTFCADGWIAQGRSPSPTLIKIDTEGAELEILQGMQQTLIHSPPKAIIFEAHWMDNRLVSQPIVDFLGSVGFETLLPAPHRNDHPANLIAVPRPG